MAMQEAIWDRKLFLDNLEIIPGRYSEIVEAVITGKKTNFQKNSISFNNQMRGLHYVNMISELENDQPLLALSRQIFLSEVLEKLTGQFVPKKMVLYRGYLLNWEKVFVIFKFFTNIAKIFSISNLLKVSKHGFTSVQDSFEGLWGSRYPTSVMRPGIAIKHLEKSSISRIMQGINNQRKIAKKLSKIIERSHILRRELANVNHLSHSEVVDSGLAGPIARAVGVITPMIDMPSAKIQNSSFFYTQFVYGKTGSGLKYLEICYREMILALERMANLLPNFLGRIDEPESLPENSGQFSASYPTSFGVNHLTVAIDDNKIRYINFVPFEFNNIEGIARLIDLNGKENTKFFLGFLNPEIEFE